MQTIKDWAIQNADGDMDIDVCDTEIDMMVAFCYVVGESSDAYEQFLDILAENVEVEKFNPTWSCLVCRFSDFYAKYRDRLIAWFHKNGYQCTEFDEDEIEYEMTLWTEGLVAGYESEDVYASLNQVFR